MKSADDVYIEIDDTRHCAQCDHVYDGDAGESCEICDEWICHGCRTAPDDRHDQTEEHLRRAAEQGAL